MEHHLSHFQQKKKSLSLLFLLIFYNNTLGIGQQYHSLFLFPVHLGHYRMFKMDMAQESGYCLGDRKAEPAILE